MPNCCQCADSITDDTALCHACCEALDEASNGEAEQRPLVPMTDEEVRRFGASDTPFGVFEGRRVDCVPLDWLDWLAGLDFIDQVRRYLASERMQAELKRFGLREAERPRAGRFDGDGPDGAIAKTNHYENRE